jgi:filamentous hemagglutinin family protein
MKEGFLHHTSTLSGLGVTLTALTVALGSSQVLAVPHSGVVAAGNAQISQNLNRTDIHQSSDRVVIDWKGFDLATDEIAQFHQPSANAVALNRVNSNVASKIAGTLKANGQVVIVNPNGVLFEKTGKIDVGGLIATTADIDNNQFMQGNYNFSKASSNPDAAIVNEGTITAKQAGLVGLVAPRVENHGMITAKLGRIELASGDTFSVDLYGDGLFELGVSDKVSEQLVRNTGTLNAPAGVIVISAASGKNIVDSLIQIEGELSAPTVSRQGGKIIIGNASAAATHGTVSVSGKLKARGTSGADKGGDITITANQVAIQDQARLDASGVGGGGTILIGGEYQGKGELATAEKTYIGQDTLIQANSLYNGDGGEVIVWADDWTKFYGTIEAQGGILGGDGGFVETSGKDQLGASGRVVVAARHNEGQGGSWLLDPRNIIIKDDAGGGPDDTGTIDADGPTFESDSDDDIVTTEAIEAVLNTGSDVIVQTGAGGAQDGDITIANNIEKTAGGDATLTLKAHRNISNSGGADITSSLGALNIIFNADADASGDGAIAITNATITTLGGNFTAGGGADPATTAATSSSSNGINISGTTITTGTGNISIRGATNAAISNTPGAYFQNNTTLSTTSGTIDLYGTTNTASTLGRGLMLNGAANPVSISSDSGDITLVAVNNDNQADSYGLMLWRTTTIDSNSGNITLDTDSSGLGTDFSAQGAAGQIVQIGNAALTGDITLRNDNIINNDYASFTTLGTLTIEEKNAATTRKRHGNSFIE